MKAISKALKLQGQEETPKESMCETISPSTLHHHKELFHGSTIKYDLEPVSRESTHRCSLPVGNLSFQIGWISVIMLHFLIFYNRLM